MTCQPYWVCTGWEISPGWSFRAAVENSLTSWLAVTLSSPPSVAAFGSVETFFASAWKSWSVNPGVVTC